MTARLGAGEVLGGRYQVERILGEGGMGAVYLARDQRLPRVWAIKEMTDAFVQPAERAEAVASFETEARMLSQLEHPNLPRITDYFSEAGRQYLVMDYVEGETLEELVQRRGKLSVDEALDLAVQVAEVLEFLHRQTPPVIFRDLKPANIIVTPQGTPKLIDFGIARFFTSGQAADTRALGTPGYAAPEQYGRGQSDARTDLYALGATLHHALSGVDPSLDPFKFAPLRTLNPEVPETLEAVVARAVSLPPESRFPDAASFRKALEGLGDEPEVFAKLPERLRTGPLPAPRVNRFEPEHLDLKRHRHGSVVKGSVVLRGPVDGRLKPTERWMRVTPTQVKGRDVPVEIVVNTAALGNGGRYAGAVLYEGGQGNERMGVEVEVEPAPVGCWSMSLAFVLTLGTLVPVLGMVLAGVLWAMLITTPRHGRPTLWLFCVAGTLLALASTLGLAGAAFAFQWWPFAQ